MKKYSLIDNLIIITTAIVFASFEIFNNSKYSTIGVIVPSFFLLLFYCLKNNWKITRKIYNFQKYMIIFSIFSFTSAIWSRQPSDAISMAITVLEIFICVTIIYWCHSQYESIKPILISFVIGGYIIAIQYFIFYGGIEKAIQYATQAKRVDVDFANINAIGKTMAVVSVVNIYCLLKYKNIKIFYGVILPIIVLLSTQSRTAFIELIVGILMILVLQSLLAGKVINAIGKFIVIVAIIIILYLLLRNLPILNGVMSRMDGLINSFLNTGKVDNSSIIRRQLVVLGIDLFKQSPLIGLGIGSAHNYVKELTNHNYYLHNNFIELLASGGVIGTFLYYTIHANIISSSLNFLKERNENKILSLTIIVMILVGDFGGVSYYYKSTYFFLIICFLIIRKQYNNDDIKL